MPSKFEQIGTPTLNVLMKFCFASPQARHNGIARCSRSLNIAWRKMHLRLVRKWITDSINYATERDRNYVGLLEVVDLEDIL